MRFLPLDERLLVCLAAASSDFWLERPLLPAMSREAFSECREDPVERLDFDGEFVIAGHNYSIFTRAVFDSSTMLIKLTIFCFSII